MHTMLILDINHNKNLFFGVQHKKIRETLNIQCFSLKI